MRRFQYILIAGPLNLIITVILTAVIYLLLSNTTDDFDVLLHSNVYEMLVKNVRKFHS